MCTECFSFVVVKTTRAAIIAYMNLQAQVAPAAETVMRLSYALSCPRSDGDASDDHHLGRNLSS
jgi:hypothetical protein